MAKKPDKGGAPDKPGIPQIKPSDALEYFRAKGFREGFSWQDVWQEEHARAFTVAKAMSRDVLETIRQGVDDALANGETLAMFEKKLTPLLQAKGWWGKQRMIDPATGEAKTVQLGSPRRLKIIYDTNIRMAMAAGTWKRIQASKQYLPYLRYSAIMDARTRPQHAEWHGTILPVDDPWWDTHYPPCGWNCRCTVIQMSEVSLARDGRGVTRVPAPAGPDKEFINSRTGEVSAVPDGIDPGFAYNVGKAWLEGVAPPPLLPPDLPALEPGITEGRVPKDAPTPASLLPENVSAEAAVQEFMDGAGVPRPAGAGGAVVLDAQDWPLAISDAWFRDEGGKLAVPSGDRRRVLGLVGQALKKPNAIIWRWVKGIDGKPMLFRRYLAQIEALDIAVDVGRLGWRYATARDEGFNLAKLSKGGATAALEEGSTFGGTAGAVRVEAYARAAMDGIGISGSRAMVVGTYGKKLAAMLHQLGIDKPLRIITLEKTFARHMLDHHGQAASEQARGQIAIDIVDLGRIQMILAATSQVQAGDPATSPLGQPRFEATATLDGVIYTVIGERRKAGVTIISMWKKRLRT